MLEEIECTEDIDDRFFIRNNAYENTMEQHL